MISFIFRTDVFYCHSSFKEELQIDFNAFNLAASTLSPINLIGTPTTYGNWNIPNTYASSYALQVQFKKEKIDKIKVERVEDQTVACIVKVFGKLIRYINCICSCAIQAINQQHPHKSLEIECIQLRLISIRKRDICVTEWSRFLLKNIRSRDF